MTDMIIIAVILVLCIIAGAAVVRRKGRCSCGCGGCGLSGAEKNECHGSINSSFRKCKDK